MPFPRASQALSRFTVLDLTRVRSGPTCVRELADWGANVIKIETPPHLEKGEGPGGPRDNATLTSARSCCTACASRSVVSSDRTHKVLEKPFAYPAAASNSRAR